MADRREAQQVASLEETETKTISINEDFLAFLHDELSENQVGLREILGESQAKAVFSWSADRLVAAVKAGKYAFSPVEGVARKLTRWGMETSWREKGSLVEIEVKCPYAERVHSRLTSKQPVCPLGEYLLGALRLDDPKSQLVRNALTSEGARFAFERVNR